MNPLFTYRLHPLVIADNVDGGSHGDSVDELKSRDIGFPPDSPVLFSSLCGPTHGILYSICCYIEVHALPHKNAVCTACTLSVWPSVRCRLVTEEGTVMESSNSVQGFYKVPRPM